MDVVIWIAGLAIIGFFVFLYSNKEKKLKIEPLVLEKYYVNTLDLDIFHIINEYRLDNGLSCLINIPTLNEVAWTNTKVLIEKEYEREEFKRHGHDDFIRRSNVFPQYKMGEICGYNFRSGEGFMQAWKMSTSHNETMLNPKFNMMGVASGKGKTKGKNYVTVMFMES